QAMRNLYCRYFCLLYCQCGLVFRLRSSGGLRRATVRTRCSGSSVCIVEAYESVSVPTLAPASTRVVRVVSAGTVLIVGSSSSILICLFLFVLVSLFLVGWVFRASTHQVCCRIT